MPDTPPRLASADPGTQPGYAPISWTAVGSLAVAILFTVALLVMGFTAFRRNQPLIQPSLLFFPALAIVLAFIARRQIRASEGTRVGEQYANIGWWLAVVSGLGYGTYLFAVEFAIRQDAEQQFARWTVHLADLNPADPKDPNFYAALHMALPPGERDAFSPKDVETINRTRANDVLAFRSSELVRVCGRNRGAIEFRVQGLRDWEQKPKEITCSLTATLHTPEGEHSLEVPMRAVIDDKKGRRWQILPSPDGFVVGRKLTRYGWLTEYLDASSRLFTQEFATALGTADQTRLAYLGYLEPGWNREHANAALTHLLATGGGMTSVPPLLPNWSERMNREVFATPAGPLSEVDRARFQYLWNSPGRIVAARAALRSNPETNPLLLMEPASIEARVPIELILAGQGGPTASIARGRLVLRVTSEADPKLFQELSEARQTASGAPKTEKPPMDLLGRKVPWRIIRIESDLKPVPQPTSSGPPGPGGEEG